MARLARVDRDIGPEIVLARANRVPWKLLMRKYDLSRTQLYCYWTGAVKQFSQNEGSGELRNI